MSRILFSLVLLLSFITSKAQDVSPTDRIQDKVILYLPTYTKTQLDNLADVFKNVHQIKKAIFIPNQHNCLVMDVKPDKDIQFYSDIIKLVSAQFNLNDIKLKTPDAYDAINGKGDNGAFTTLKK